MKSLQEVYLTLKPLDHHHNLQLIRDSYGELELMWQVNRMIFIRAESMKDDQCQSINEISIFYRYKKGWLIDSSQTRQADNDEVYQYFLDVMQENKKIYCRKNIIKYYRHQVIGIICFIILCILIFLTIKL